MSMHGDFECPFSWKPDIESSIYNFFEVIDEAKSKMERHLFLEDAYKSVLVYLFTRPAVADYNMAWDWLEQIKDNNMPADFIKRANRLYLNKLLNENSNNDSEVEIISKLWNSPKTKLAILIMKGATFNCFGPKLYQKAVDAYEDAVTVSQNMEKAVSDAVDISNLMFYALWGQAYSMSRITGLTFNKPPTDEELKIWHLANDRRLQIQGLDVVEHMWFCCQFAESMMSDKEKKDPCLKLVGSVFSKWERLSETRKVHNTGMLLICNKVLKRYGENELFGKEEADLFQGMMKVTEDFLEVWNKHDEKFKKSHLKPFLNSLKIYKKCVRRKKAVGKFSNLFDAEKYLGNNIDYHIQLSRTYDYEAENEKAIKLLEIAKSKLDRHSRNISIDLELLNRQSSLKKDEKWTRREYESLLLRYCDCNRNRASILLKRSEFVFYEAKKEDNNFWDYMDESMKNLIEAKDTDSEITIRRRHCKNLHRVLEKNEKERPEYLAWFYYKVAWNEQHTEEICTLFENAIRSPFPSHKNFALEHLGKFLLYETKDFQRATNLFLKLQLEKGCQYLLSEAILRQCSDDNTSLELLLLKCLELGNCDVIGPILTLLEERKNGINLKNELQKQNFFNQDQSHLFFSRKNYEICATIEILLEQNCDVAFFVDRRLGTCDTLRDEILHRISKLLEIPIECPEKMVHIWRRRRLDVTKMHTRKSMKLIKIKKLNQRIIFDLPVEEQKRYFSTKKRVKKRWHSAKDQVKKNSEFTEVRQTKSEIDSSKGKQRQRVSDSNRGKGRRKRWSSTNEPTKQSFSANSDQKRTPSECSRAEHKMKKSSSAIEQKVDSKFSDFSENFSQKLSLSSSDERKKQDLDFIQMHHNIEESPSPKEPVEMFLGSSQEQLESLFPSEGHVKTEADAPEKKFDEISASISTEQIKTEARFMKENIIDSDINFTKEEQYAFNLKIMDVLRDSKSPLDRCIKKLCPADAKNCYHPFAFKELISYQKQQSKRMETMLGMELCHIKKILTKEFKAKKIQITEQTDNIISFLANREYHIIQNEGAWYALWLKSVDNDKHNEPWNMRKFEEEVNQYRSVGQPKRNASAYEVAHWAAEFAEQSIVILEIEEPKSSNI